MNKFKLILLFLIVSLFEINAQNAFRGFEGALKDNWGYNSNIPFYNQNSGTDLWTQYSQANGRIPGPFAGSSYLTARDLDNPHSEDASGQASPEHRLTFNAFEIDSLGAEFTFRLYYAFLDKNDYIYCEFYYDNGTDWTQPDEHLDVFSTSQGGKFSISSWDEIRYDIPTGIQYVRIRLTVYQNGNGYIGFDNFELKANTLSTKNNVIEGFSFGPNPTDEILKLRANVVLDKAEIYNISGKKVLSQFGNSTKMVLDISQLSSGIYLTKVESKGLSQTIKVIKK